MNGFCTGYVYVLFRVMYMCLKCAVFAWLPDGVEQVTFLKRKGCLPLRE